MGIDSAATAIERGRALAASLDLTNVTLEPVAIEDYEPAAGAFDYVIAHGVYSWVAPPLRDRLLALCGRALAPGGVAYVSYNALPGARIRQALRDMLRFHTAGLEDPRERAESARALLRFLVEGWPATREHTAALRHQAEQALERSDASLLHDELAEYQRAGRLRRVRRARGRARAAVPRRGRLLRDADGGRARAGARRPALRRGSAAPRAVPRLHQGPHVPAEPALPRGDADRPSPAPGGRRAPRVLLARGAGRAAGRSRASRLRGARAARR